MTVYLLHFRERHRHAGHYIGSAVDLDARLAEHKAGRGARLLAVVKDAGITWTLARTWPGGRARERQIKNQGGASRRCPMCGVKPRKEPAVETGRAADVLTPEEMEFVERAGSDAGVARRSATEVVAQAGDQAAQHVVTTMADAGMPAERIDRAAEDTLGLQYDAEPTPVSASFWRGFSTTAQILTSDLRELEKPPEPGTPHPDPFLARKGWAIGRTGIYERHQAARRPEIEAEAS